jgi:hypothetical protein
MKSSLPHSSRRGAALIIALAIMVLVLALVVGILSRVSTERSSAGGYASSVGARLLADTAVQLVQAQIDTATSGTTTAWVSQPGLVRTFSTAGAPARSFKLYSSGAMQVNGALNPATEAATLAQWYQSPALFTDINMPVDTNFDGTPDTWPILDPSAAGVVEGFSITGAPVGKYLGIQNAAPMPVNWLYILQDGQVVSPVASGSAAAIAGASDVNPIVGRIAFWTDDETAKINVNTASEGAYWDVPKFTNVTDQNLGIYQPVKNEFQGYPGHPAGVSLSTVFPDRVTGAPASAYDQLYALTPRIATGGSLNLTRAATEDLAPVVFDQDRLYANGEELIFKNDRQPQGLTSAELERAKFFVTAVSRAPEVNLFNLPKIVSWPLHESALTHRSAFDRLIAFCGTLNGEPYYFQRKNKDSATEDYSGIARNQTLYSYLQTLTSRPVPGFGGTLAARLGADRDQVLTEIFDYIRCTNLNDLNLADATRQFAPGTGNRAVGQGEVVPIKIGSTRGFGRYATISELGLWFICTADADVAVSNDPATNLTLAAGTPLTKDSPVGTKQLRIEAAVLLDPFTPMHGSVPMHPDIEVLIEGLENWTVKGTGDAAAQSLGFPAISRQLDSDAGLFRFGTNSGWVSSLPNTGGYMGTNWAFQQRQTRARNGGRLARDAGFDGSIDSSGVKNKQNPFVGEPVTITVDKLSPRMAIEGPPVTISIRNRVTGEVVQQIKMALPETAAPAPKLSWTGTSGEAWTFQQSGAGAGGKPALGRFTSAGPSVDRNNDVIYSLVASKQGSGQTLDPRFLAMTEVADETFFSLHPKADGSNAYAHSIISNPISGFGGYTPGSANGNTGTLAGLGAGKFHPFSYQPTPKVPFPASAAMANGDWDNGIGALPDGGFLNQADQGNLAARTDSDASFGYLTPYFSVHNKISGVSTTFTSPSRMMPSPGMFGSLPSGFKRDQPWQTLLFRRQPGHPGYGAANGGFINNPEYLLMDFFWMPVVEPYAISEPLSSAGKINMNTQIIPFTYIERDTGLHAVLKHERVISVPTADYNGVYKNATSNQSAFSTSANYRRAVKIPETLRQFQQRFDNSDGTGLYAFRTAAEICDMHIIPDDAAVNTATKASIDSSMADYWATRALTGDNSRERIYTTLYPRLTTKSNTFTVHFRAQSLKKRAGTAAGTWDESRDLVTGDYRGATTLERYVNPGDAIPDYASDPDAAPSLDTFYRWRLRAHRPFAP